MSTDPRDENAANEQQDGGREVSADEQSFAETAMRMGGKSDEEARRTGAIDKADDQVEQLFQAQYQTVNSPAHRAVWESGAPVEMFSADVESTPANVQKVMDDSLDVVRQFRSENKLFDENKRLTEELFRELGDVGYWGLLVGDKHGGSNAPFRSFAPFLTRMAILEPTVAGLASVHGCIGAVDPVRTFGNDEQKRKYLPQLASGQKLSAFALTEPCAGSDLTALKTTAELRGEHYVVNGEKLFITNVTPWRTIGLVCLIEGKPAVLICDLPDAENDQFQLLKYGIYALKHTYNRGIVFKDFLVPKENLLEPVKGNGLTIAYHGLNLGRIALCANAAGVMRTMMASMIPWSEFRVTYGEAIANRELVQRRLGRLAGLIVASDALVNWCSTLIDQGFRGEMECIVAKIFGSESLKEAAIEIFMKTHGGRSFLHGHLLGDHVHEYLAPCIYEGEGEMLGMAFFKSLVKQHGSSYFEPVGRALQKAGIKKPNPLNPAHMWALKDAMAPYAKWMLKQYATITPSPKLPTMSDRLQSHAHYAYDRLQSMPLTISGVMRKHQLKLADRQCRMSLLSSDVQKLIIMMCTCLHAASQDDEIVVDAADVICRDMRREIEGRRPSDRDFRQVTALGGAIIDGKFKSIAGLEPDEVLMPY